MPATVTLGSTTLSQPVSASDSQIQVSSTSGLTVGTHLFCEGELVAVVSLGADPAIVRVRRGVGGTTALDHDSSAPVWIGRGDQFFSRDPVGSPPEAPLVSPWINVVNGTVWFAQGDSEPSGQTYRWWQKQETTWAQGALGIRTSESNPTSST